MIKHWRNDFPSDIFVILEGVGATVTLGSSPENSYPISNNFVKKNVEFKYFL